MFVEYANSIPNANWLIAWITVAAYLRLKQHQALKCLMNVAVYIMTNAIHRKRISVDA